MKNVTIRIVAMAVVAAVGIGAAVAQAAPGKGMAERTAHPREIKGVANLNTASIADLTLLPKVGPATAQRIIEYRDKNGGFKKVEEILNVRGIGEKSFDLMKPYLTLAGPTTIKLGPEPLLPKN